MLAVLLTGELLGFSGTLGVGAHPHSNEAASGAAKSTQRALGV
jgi:hypothetical protein